MMFSKKILTIVLFEIALIAALAAYLFADRGNIRSEGYVEQVWCENYSWRRGFIFMKMHDETKILAATNRDECKEMVKYYDGRFVSYEYEKDSGFISELEYKGESRFTKRKNFWATFGFCVSVFLLVNGAIASLRKFYKKLKHKNIG